MSQQPKKSSVSESFYQSTPRVDADIGPLTFFPSGSKCSTALTLPTDPALFMKNTRTKSSFQSDNELPQNIVNEARANLQSHVSDFFQQISMATSPEDVMEADSVPFSKNRVYFQNQGRAASKFADCSRMSYLPKLARIAKIHARNKTPYHGGKIPSSAATGSLKAKSRNQTPLAGKLSNLAIDQDLPKFENMDNTVTEVLNR